MTGRPEVRRRDAALGAVLAAAFAAACSSSPEPSAGPRFEVVERTIPELQEAMASGRVTSRELVRQYLARIEAYDQRGPSLNGSSGC